MTPLQEMKLMAEAGERARLSLTAERDELMQARNGLVENNDALHIQLAELKAQRDEGLAREAELRKRLAESIPDFIKLSPEMKERGDREVAEARAFGCASVDSLEAAFSEAAIQVWIDHRQDELASPGCADGEKPS